MYEGMTYEKILADMLTQVSSPVDKREGSLIWDALAPAAWELARLYEALEQVLQEGFADTASRQYLVLRASERGLKPRAAGVARALGRIELTGGAQVALGRRFCCDRFNWRVVANLGDNLYELECEETGSQPNAYIGHMVPLEYLNGLNKAELEKILVPGEDEEDTESLLRHAESAGADGAGVVTPWFLTANRRELEAYYAAAAACVSEDFPLYLYNIPQCAANDLDAETVEALAGRFPNIVGIKYSYADINRTMDYLRVRNWSFSVMHGCDRTFLAFLALGCDGTVSGISGVFPEPFTAVYRAFQAGNWAEALTWQRRAARITDILRGGSNMSYFKEALKLRGLDAGHMRRPQLDLPEAEVAALRAQLEDFCQDAGLSLKL